LLACGECRCCWKLGALRGWPGLKYGGPLALERHEGRLMHGDPRRLAGWDFVGQLQVLHSLSGADEPCLACGTSKNKPKSIANTGIMVVAGP
jgi:hypothetical protein